MRGLTERERKLVALAILAAVFAALWLGAVSPILAGFATRREQRAEAEAELARDARLIASFPALRTRYAALKRDQGAALLSAKTGPQAVEAARAAVTATAAHAGVRLQTLRPSKIAPAQVRLQACLLTGLPGLIDFLRRLEAAPPYAAVDTLSITAAGPAGEVGAASSPLQACFEVSYSYADLR